MGPAFGGPRRVPLSGAITILVLLTVVGQGVPMPELLGSAGASSPDRPALAAAAGSSGTIGPFDAADSAPSPAPLALPGTNPSGEPFFDAGAIASKGPWASDGHALPSTPPPGGPPGIATATPAPASRGAPDRPLTGNGTVIGYVRDSISGRAIDGAIVSLELASGGCRGSSCPSGITDYRGYFAISAPPGFYTVIVGATNYSENDTSVTVFAGAVASVGTVELEPDAVILGTLEGDDSAHEPISGFDIATSSRNAAVPGGITRTTSNGSFRVGAPPVADRIDFSVPVGAPYEANHTFVFPGPGQTIDLGVVYLLRATVLNITVLDRVTRTPIGPNSIAHIFTCQQRTTACPIPPSSAWTTGIGPNETADAAPGPTVLHVLIVGYVVNVTPIGNVPPEPAGTVFHLTVNVTPMGAVEIAPELTGGNPPVGGTNLTTDQWWKYVNTNTNVSGAVVCSLDGLSVAIFTAVGIVPDPCVPNILSRFEGTTTLLGPPLRDWVGIGSASAAVPLFENMTWVNLTPDRLTNAGPLNFTPGAYLTGDVYVQGTTDPPPSFSVQACSTDEQEICGPVVGYAGTGDHGSPNGSLAGCDTGPSGFCVPAPPGPVVLSVTGSGTVTGTTNTTWAYVPYRCCVASPHALSLWNSTDPHVRSINLTNGYGRVAGQVASGGGVVAPTLSYVEVEACLVSATSNPPCSTTVTENGSFSLEAAIGWNQVTATASGYMSNSTWIDVTGSNTTGTIVLTPLAVLTGRVVTPNGTGVLGAVLQYCPIAPAIASQPGCTPVGSGATGTGGYYSGPLPGGPFPSSAYQVIATASGYSGNWTWVNVTPGALVVAPRIVLEPIGNASAPSALALGPRPQNGSLSTWVVGRVADARTHLAIPDATLTACSIATSSTCVPFSDSTSTGGEFNATLGLGAYELSVGMDGYVPATLYLNATGLGTVDLGTIGLTPYPWVAGRVAIAPWPSLTIADGLGPDPAGVTVCTSQQAVCGPTGLVNTAGFFNVSAPVGASDDLAVNASGGVTFDGLTGAASQGGGTSGFVPLGIPLDVPSNGTTVGLGGNGVPTLSIFAPVTGTLYDLSTSNSTAHRPGSPARWATLEVSGPQAGAAQTMYISGGGQFTALVPPNETVRLVGSGSAYLRVATGGTAVGAPATAVSAGALELPHYGWVTTLVTTSTGEPVPFASVNASLPDPANHTRVISAGFADGDGYINLTAPPGANLTVRATASGYGSSSSAVTAVQTSRTSSVGLPGLTGATSELLVRSASVNTVSGPAATTVRDRVSGLPLGDVSVSVTNGAGDLVDLPTTTNGLGQFMLAVDVEPLETLGFVKNGYQTNYSDVPSPTPSGITVRIENLTGDGVVAGDIVGLPTERGVVGANVTACPDTGAQICTTVETNGAGEFWLARPPGDYIVSVAASDYDSNISFGVSVCPDCFLWVGSVPLYGDAVVSGTVVGAPERFPIAGANVTLCPTNGSFFLECVFPTPTGALGNFRLLAPVGSYTFRASAPDFGPVSFPVDLGIGEPVDMGLVALPADGGFNGTVVNATSGDGLANATIEACPTGSTACESAGPTGPAGTFGFANLTEGPYTLTVSATGYVIGYASVTVLSDATAQLSPLALWPDGVTPQYPLSGTVLWNATGAPVDGARVVGDTLGGGRAAQAVTGSNGTFRLPLEVGAYRLVVTLPGARSVRLNESVVSGPVENVNVRLDPMTYRVHGTVTGSGPNVALPGVLLRAGALASTLTGPDGSYGLELANGSYRVSATPTSGAQSYEFAGVVAPVRVNGTDASLDLLLPERDLAVALTVLDASSGLGLSGVAGSASGSDGFGVAHSARFSTGPNGSADIALPIGSYSLFVNASGFVPLDQPFEVTSLGASLVVGLTALGSSASAAHGPSGAVLTIVGAIDGGALVVALAAFWLTRRRRARPRGPTPPGSGNEETAGTDPP